VSFAQVTAGMWRSSILARLANENERTKPVGTSGKNLTFRNSDFTPTRK